MGFDSLASLHLPNLPGPPFPLYSNTIEGVQSCSILLCSPKMFLSVSWALSWPSLTFTATGYTDLTVRDLNLHMRENICLSEPLPPLICISQCVGVHVGMIPFSADSCMHVVARMHDTSAEVRWGPWGLVLICRGHKATSLQKVPEKPELWKVQTFFFNRSDACPSGRGPCLITWWSLAILWSQPLPESPRILSIVSQLMEPSYERGLMSFAKEFIIILVTNTSSLDSHPEHGFSAKRTHSCGQGHVCSVALLQLHCMLCSMFTHVKYKSLRVQAGKVVLIQVSPLPLQIVCCLWSLLGPHTYPFLVWDTVSYQCCARHVSWPTHIWGFLSFCPYFL